MTDNDDRSRFAELAEWLTSWSWPVEEAAVGDLVEARGWTPVDSDPGNGATFDTGIAEQKSWASFLIDEGRVADVSITTVFVDGDDADAEKTLTDSFADQVEAVTAVLGRPRRKKSGRSASALWDLPNGAMLDVGRASRSCSWQFTSPAYAEVQRQLGG